MHSGRSFVFWGDGVFWEVSERIGGSSEGETHSMVATMYMSCLPAAVEDGGEFFVDPPVGMDVGDAKVKLESRVWRRESIDMADLLFLEGLDRSCLPFSDAMRWAETAQT